MFLGFFRVVAAVIAYIGTIGRYYDMYIYTRARVWVCVIVGRDSWPRPLVCVCPELLKRFTAF